jgi:hypothetical protein
MAIVHEEVFDCTDLSRYLIADPAQSGALIEVFRAYGMTPGAPDLAAATHREQFQFSHMRTHFLVVGNRYRIVVEDYVAQ